MTREVFKIKDKESADAVKDIIQSKHVSMTELSTMLEKSENYTSALLYIGKSNKRNSIRKDALEKLSMLLTGSKDGLFQYFERRNIMFRGRPRNVTSTVNTLPLEAGKPAEIKTQYGMFKSGNGYRYTFSDNGKDRTVYGMTHSECYRKAKELTEAQKEPVAENKITLSFCDGDALILSERLFKLLRESKEVMTEEEYETIRSIYCRLNIQLV